MIRGIKTDRFCVYCGKLGMKGYSDYRLYLPLSRKKAWLCSNCYLFGFGPLGHDKRYKHHTEYLLNIDLGFVNRGRTVPMKERFTVQEQEDQSEINEKTDADKIADALGFVLIGMLIVLVVVGVMYLYHIGVFPLHIGG